MRSLLALGVALSFGALAGVGPAGAARITGTERADRLSGTPRADAIYGLAGNDVLDGLGGDDFLEGGPGRDSLSGSDGDDRLSAHADGARDAVRCGEGTDVVNAELQDTVAADCEVVSRQLSRDPTTSFDAQHATEVEPDSFAFGSMIVTAFQAGRFVGGGAASIGFATSLDGGRRWRTGFLPGLTIFSTPAGTLDAASDPVVAYDAAHEVWLIATLGASIQSWELLVSRSVDGYSWTLPVSAAHAPVGSVDKEWIACDNWPSSPFRGRCYLSYLDIPAKQIVTRSSSDGGLTWSAPIAPPPAGVPSRAFPNGAQPLVQPDGTLVVVFATQFGVIADEDQIVAIRSMDGGASFGPAVQVATLQAEQIQGMRSPPLPSAEVDAAGRLYVAWSDCRFSEECVDNRVVLVTSLDGIGWSEPAPVGPFQPGMDAFLPGLGVDPLTAGGTARVAVVYHTLPHGCSYTPSCPGVDVWLVSSANGGRTWGRAQRLNAESMPLEWIADSGIGRMLGDYVSTSFVNGRAIPVFALAAERDFDSFRQAIFARVPPVRR